MKNNQLLFALSSSYSKIASMEIYEELKMNIIYFDAQDIVTASPYDEEEGVIVLPFMPA